MKYTFVFVIFILGIFLSGCEEDKEPEIGNLSVELRTETECPINKNKIVIVGFGQSNAANSGETLYYPEKKVLNFFNNKCYLAEDPLLGNGGTSGSVWSRLGDLLLSKYDNVIINAFGVGGSSINSWIPGGTNHSLMINNLTQLIEAGLEPDVILWHQGETDAMINMSTKEYYDKFLLIRQSIRNLGITSDIYVAKATVCNYGINKPIYDAQTLLSNDFEDIKVGADTDFGVSKDYRYDNCHMDTTGLLIHANLWKEVILK